MDRISTTPVPGAGEPDALPDAAEEAQNARAAHENAHLRTRLAELQRERDHLAAIVEMLQESSASLHFTDILQAIARRLGDTFGLDRATIFLTGDEANEVRLVASYEDPSRRNLVVDLERYPELRRAFESKETVFIPDAANDPALRSIKATLDSRNVRSIIVVPIQWQGSVIGAIFLRTERGAEPFSDADVRFCQTVAGITATALRNAHRVEPLLRAQQDSSVERRRAELQRIALIAFLRRLFERVAGADDQAWAETLLPRASGEELERLVSVAMQVLDEESKGG